MRKSLSNIVAAVAVFGLAAAAHAQVAPASLEMREEASIIGSEVQLRQVGRWSSKDNAFFVSLGDMVIARFEPGQKQITVSLDGVRETLAAAGVGGAELGFRGSVTTKVLRLDAAAPHAQKATPLPAKDLGEFLDRAGAPKAEANPAPTVVAVQPPLSVVTPPAVAEDEAQTASSRVMPPMMPAVPVRTLRDDLTNDLAGRLGLKVDDVEMAFEPADERVLRLANPAFSWGIAATRVRNLGPVSWTITLGSGSQVKRVEINAKARAWQNQLVLKRALAANQIVRPDDVEEKRVLVERLNEESLFTREQALMMASARELGAGVVLSGRMLTPVTLIKPNQLVNVTLASGAFEIKAVARAMEAGAYGQAIKVKNEATNDVLVITVTGPQEGRLGPAVQEERK